MRYAATSTAAGNGGIANAEANGVGDRVTVVGAGVVGCLVAWLAAAAHELPQELGDFGILVHGGWPRRRALLWNFLSALTFPLGAVIAWLAAAHVDLSALVLFGAGNFIYIAASDLVPEIKRESGAAAMLVHFACFVSGLVLTGGLAFVAH